MKKVTAICPQCGKDFQFYPSAYPDKPKMYCSRKCQSEAAWLHKECAWCGAPFTCRRSDPTECCSKTCGRRRAMQGRKITLNCDQCGEPITRKLSDFYGKGQTTHFCSLRCFGDWQKEHPPEHITARRECRINRVCKECNKEFDRVPSAMLRKGEGAFCSSVCKGRYYGKRTWRTKRLVYGLKGPANPNWKGGHIKYYGPNWREQRRQARKRDGYTCYRCGITEIDLGIELDVHHIRPFREFGIPRHEEANHLDNLISLCNYCHKVTEPTGGDHRSGKQKGVNSDNQS